MNQLLMFIINLINIKYSVDNIVRIFILPEISTDKLLF
jgi:hypothetical protein